MQTIVTKNAIIHICRPVLTEEERAKRMKAIEEAAARLVLANWRAEALEKQQQSAALGT